MEKEYYILWYRLQNRDAYLIWYSDETDGVLTDSSDKIISFDTKEQLLEYALKVKIDIKSEILELHNIDLVSEWIKANDPEKINFTEFNNIWNLWTDIANSINGSFYQDSFAIDKIYDKLFWSCDLPTASAEDNRYFPEWTEDELATMKELFSNGINMFQQSLVSLEN